jgi:hypothetical protein
MVLRRIASTACPIREINTAYNDPQLTSERNTMFKKAKAYWAENKSTILRKLVIYGGIGIGIAAVGYLAAKDEEAEREAQAQPEPETLVIYETIEDN